RGRSIRRGSRRFRYGSGSRSSRRTGGPPPVPSCQALHAAAGPSPAGDSTARPVTTTVSNAGRGGTGTAAGRLSTTAALAPAKAKLLETATSAEYGRAPSGTESRSHPGSGSRDPSVGG